MNHETCLERLVELAYGELSRRDAADVERHLAECLPCRIERDRMAATVGAMRRLEAPPPPERGDAVVLAAARQAAAERRRDSFGLALRSFSLRIAAGTAFAVLAVILVVNVKHGLRPPTEDVARERAAASREPMPVAAPVGREAEPPSPAAAASAKPEAFRRERAKAAPAQDAPARKKAATPNLAARQAAPSAPAPLKETPAEERERPVRRSAEVPEEYQAGSARSERAPSAAQVPPPPAAGAQAAVPRADERRRLEMAAPASPEAAGGRSGDRAAPRQDGFAQLRAASGPASSWAREIERRHAAGELSEAQKRFEPCPGGDVRRTAWIDGAQRVLKLVRERADGVVVEEWFDESGRLREALVRGHAAGGAWARHVTTGERGEETAEDVSGSGLAPDAPPPPLVKRDPSSAFFSGPGCSR